MAILTLVKACNQDFHLKKRTKNIKALYASAGEVRELQLKLEFWKNNKMLETIPGYADLLTRQLHWARDAFRQQVRHLLKNETPKTLNVKLLTHYLPTPKTINTYLNRLSSEIEQTLRDPKSENMELHTLRKKIKDLLFLERFLFPSTGPDAGSERRPRRLGQLRMTRGQNEPPAALSVSPDGAFLAIRNQTNGDLLILPRTQKDGADSFPFLHPVDLEQAGRTQWKLSKHARPINDLRWSSDSQHLLTASDDRSIGVWDRYSDGAGLKFRKDVRGHGARVLQCLFLNPEATRFASSSADLQSRLWDLTTLDSDTKQLRQAFRLSMLEPAEHRPFTSAS